MHNSTHKSEQSYKKSYRTLRLILGDQLNADHSWFKTKDPEVLYVIAELHQEQHYEKQALKRAHSTACTGIF